MLKKIILGIMFLNFSLFGSAINFNSTLPNIKIGNLDSKIKESKKYSDLIKALESAPTGEFSFYLGIIYLNGINKPDSEGKTIKKDIEKAKFFFNKAIQLGYYNAAQILGALYLYHKDFMKEPNNIEKAEYYLNLAIKNGLYDGTTSLAEIYINYKNNYKKGLEYLELGSVHNIPTSQLMLAMLYNWGYKNPTTGFQIKKDPYTAQMLLTKACTNKNITKKVKEFCSSKYVKINKKEE